MFLQEPSSPHGLRKNHVFLTMGAPTPLPHACVAAIRLPESYYHERAREYDRKRHILFDGLRKAGLTCEMPKGAYYILTDIDGFGMNDTVFASHIFKKAGVAAVMGISFYHEGGETKLRFTFSKRTIRLSRRVAGWRHWISVRLCKGNIPLTLFSH